MSIESRDVFEIKDEYRSELRWLKGLLKGATKVGLMIGYAKERWEPSMVWLELETIDDIRQFFGLMVGADAVQIVPLSREMTTQEAAEFLGISRPSLIKLVEMGELKCLKPTPGGRHRRLLLSDLVAFRDRLAEEAAERGRPLLLAGREKFLSEARQAQ